MASSDVENEWNFNHPGIPVTDGLVLWLPMDEETNNPFSFTIGNSYSFTVTTYSFDGSTFTTASTVNCSTY